jgi:hypothetical protein
MRVLTPQQCGTDGFAAHHHAFVVRPHVAARLACE